MKIAKMVSKETIFLFGTLIVRKVLIPLFKYIIFDFDGTLIDSKDLSIRVINDLARKYNFNPLTRDQIAELRKISIIDRCKAIGFPIHKIPFAMNDFLKIYKKSIGEIEFFDGVKELLNSLKENGFELAIISSNSEEAINGILRKNNITAISEVISGKNIFGKDKIIRKFIKKHRLPTKDVLYVGDELRDVVACNRIGVKVAWVSWGFDDIDVFKEDQQPSFIANQLEDIVTIANRGYN